MVLRGAVEIRVLGPFGVLVGGRQVPVPQGRLRVLLVMLALSAGREVGWERLVDAVWGEDLPASPRRSLQTYVARLRSLLGTEAVTTGSSGYVLWTDPENVDALRFLALVDRAAEEPGAERGLLGEALGLWRGAPFEGVESDWSQASEEAARLSERRLGAVERRADLDLADGRHVDVVPELRELLVGHPLRESLWARLLLALAGSGRAAEALEQYETVRVRLADELGADPGAGLQRVHADLLAGTPPEPVAGVARSDRTGSVVPRQLPGDISGFTGRTQALSALDGLLGGDEGRPIAVVHGTGGVGKTSLVVHWASRLSDRFPGGQLFVNLRGYGPGEPRTPAAGLEVLLRGLGLSGEQIPADAEARAGLLRSLLAQRRMLVVLDNARHADQVRPLLPGAGDSVVVVTSRSQLRSLVAREGARRIGLDKLEPTESVALLATTLDAADVRYDKDTLAELADRCDHLPLALAIAAEHASRQPEAGLVGLVRELRDEHERLDAFDAGDESADLRAVFAWSYRALDSDVARLFRLLGLHPGPDFGLPAAAALAGERPAKVRRLLDRLLEANLLQQGAPGRYELHDLLRTYAAELVADDAGRDVALDRFYDWCVHTAAVARRTYSPRIPLVDVDDVSAADPATFDGIDHALAWFEAERAVLVAAAHRAVRLGRDGTACRIANFLGAYLTRNHTLDDLFTLLPLVIDAAERAGDASAQALTALQLGYAHHQLSHHEQAFDWFQRSLGEFERAGHARGQAAALAHLGVNAEEGDRLAEAAEYCERSIAIARRVGAPEELNGLNGLAYIYRKLGRLDDAAEASERAIEAAQRHRDRLYEGCEWDTLGQVRTEQGRHREAVEHFRRAVELLGKTREEWYEGAALTNLGRAHRTLGQPDQARECWERALAIFDAVGTVDQDEFSRAELAGLLDTVPTTDR